MAAKKHIQKSALEEMAKEQTHELEETLQLEMTQHKRVEETLEHKENLLQMIISATVKNSIKLPTTIFGHAKPTKIKPIIKETRAFNIFCPSPKSFVFSRIANKMKKTNKSG